MVTVEVPRETWVERLNAFTLAHEGWIASLEIFGPTPSRQPVVVSLPLIGVSAERVTHDGTVFISLARSKGGHLTHVVEDVSRVYIQSDNSATAALFVDSGDGTRTALRLRAIPPR